MSNEAATARTRPRRSAINRLAATLLAREFEAKIPEYASYVGTEGLDALASRIDDAVKRYPVSRLDPDEIAKEIELATMVGAPARTAALLAGYPKLHTEAAVLLEGGWIRETARQPPFEGDFARVGILRGDELPRVGYAFRTPDLDARGMLMFVQTRRAYFSGLRGELVTWEMIEGVEAVQDCDLPQVEARHHWLQTLAARENAKADSTSEQIGKAFAEAEFSEIAPVERAGVLISLSDELARSIAEKDGPALMDVLGRLGGIAAAAATIADPSELMDDAPEEPRAPVPRG